MKKLMVTVLLLVAMIRPAFTPGECVLFMDQPGKMDHYMIVRVEGFDNGNYKYRWWTFNHEWAIDLGKVLSNQKMFERLFKRVECPDASI